eukprot:240368_1
MVYTMIIHLMLFIGIVCSGNQQWSVNISNSTMNHFYYYWNECVGSGHGSLLLRNDWRQHMKYGHDQINFSLVRCHGILDDDIGVVNGINDYSFINIDNIYSYLLSINMKPFVEVSFMPEIFAINSSETIAHYKAITSPPISFDLWYNFIRQWIKHLIDYFGINEIRQWKFEIWNEPNGNGHGFWYGNYSQYVMLYNATVTAIKSIDKYISVGGPATEGFGWLDQFLENILSQNIPIDFVTTHSYPNLLSIKDINSWINTLQTQGIDIVNKYNSKYNISLPLLITEYNSGCCINAFGNYWNDDNSYAPSFIIFWAK